MATEALLFYRGRLKPQSVEALSAGLAERALKATGRDRLDELAAEATVELLLNTPDDLFYASIRELNPKDMKTVRRRAMALCSSSGVKTSRPASSTSVVPADDSRPVGEDPLQLLRRRFLCLESAVAKAHKAVADFMWNAKPSQPPATSATKLSAAEATALNLWGSAPLAPEDACAGGEAAGTCAQAASAAAERSVEGRSCTPPRTSTADAERGWQPNWVDVDEELNVAAELEEEVAAEDTLSCASDAATHLPDDDAGSEGTLTVRRNRDVNARGSPRNSHPHLLVHFLAGGGRISTPRRRSCVPSVREHRLHRYGRAS